MKNEWTEYEIKVLTENLNKSDEELSKLLNRTKYSIRGKIRTINSNNNCRKTKFEDINWLDVQNYYNCDNMWDDVLKKFNINSTTLNNAVKLNLFKTRSKSESVSLSYKKKPRTLSDETKKKISISRTKYLKEHPEKVPYLLNHYSKGPSYPESYFDEIFEGKFDYEKYLQASFYHIDFAIINKKIAIEIDGDQHYLDKKIVQSDIRKDAYLTENCWDIIRIKWSDYQKMTREEKEKYISDLLNYINNLSNSKPEIEYKKINNLSNSKPIIEYKDNSIYCVDCGKKISKTSIRCVECAHLLQRKIERPPKDELLLMVKETSLEAVGRKYGVTGNSIKKWLK